MTILSFALLTLAAHPLAMAATPTTAQVDAVARAEGSQIAIARSIGERIFSLSWPAQVMKVQADGADNAIVAGLRISGVKFRGPLTRDGFEREVASLAEIAFAYSNANEVDVWAEVPLNVGKGIVVSGDLAQTTFRTVFTLSAHRGETPASMVSRMRAKAGVYWDEDWARTLVNKRG